MRLFIVTTLCLTLYAGSSWGQQTLIKDSTSGQQQQSGTISYSGASGHLIDTLLHPLRPFLGQAGHKAFHNALEVIPMSVLNQVSNLGQLFGALITWNPSAVPQLINEFFPGASSLFASLLPSIGSAGLGALTSLATNAISSNGLGSLLAAGLGSNPFTAGINSLRQDSSSFPSSAGSSSNSFNPANIASDLVGQGLSNFAGVTNSLAAGQPLSALLTMAGGAADTANRFGNLASSGLNMATQAASRLPGPIGQMSSTFSSMIPGSSSSSSGSGSGSGSGSVSSSFGGSSSSVSANSGRGNGRGSASASFSSPLGSFLTNNPFTAFLSGR